MFGTPAGIITEFLAAFHRQITFVDIVLPSKMFFFFVVAFVVNIEISKSGKKYQ